MRKLLIGLSVGFPALTMLVLYWQPALDVVAYQPIFAFYLLCFFGVATGGTGLMLVRFLRRRPLVRHRLLALLCGVVGTLFAVQAVLMQGVLLEAEHPAFAWAGWLAYLLAGVLLFVASMDEVERPLPLHIFYPILFISLFVPLTFILQIWVDPSWLERGLAEGMPFALFIVTFALLWVAGWRLHRLWQSSGLAVDGVLVLMAVWFLLGAIALYGFPYWGVGRWLSYMKSFFATTTGLVYLGRHYEQGSSEFHLLRYYGVTSLLVTAVVALSTSYIVAELVSATRTTFEAVAYARTMGLLVAGGAMGILFLALLVVVYRADTLIRDRTNALIEANHALEEANKLRNDLNDMIVHDLKSPLTAVNMNLQLLDQRHKLTGARRSYIDHARSALQRALKLVNDLLDVTRLEEGKLSLQPHPLHMGDLLHEQVVLHAWQAERDNKGLEVSVPDDLPLIMADEELLRRVLDNLVSNALRHTGRGGRVDLRAWANGRCLMVEVADNGIGIAPQDVSRIFDKFAQATHHSTQRRGTGLGLTFCRLAISAHQGDIWVESVPNEGSHFFLCLPLNLPLLTKPRQKSTITIQ